MTMLIRPAALATMLFALACTETGQTPLVPPADGPATRMLAEQGRHRGALGVVYVRSQGLYYDTFVSAQTLPMQGEFQKIENGVTEYGPGDPEYKGGRWWADANGNGVQDEGDRFFLCPLLPPGRSEP